LPWWRRSGPERSDLERTLQRYLDLQIAQLERAAAAEVEAHRQSEVRAAVGQLVTRLVLVAGYALVLGLASRGRVLSALLDPGQLAQNAELARSSTEQAIELVPDALRGLAISAVSALALLVLRGASFSVRADIGGAVFVGIAIVSLVGLSAAAYSGVLGLLFALPGYLAAALVVQELLRTLRRMRATEVPSTLSRRLARLDPTRRPWLTAAFLAIPAVCVAVIAASFVTSGGPLFWPSRSAMYGFVAWCLWACAATPGTVRIPLWAAVPWSVLFGLQLAADPVSFVFVVAAVGLLIANLLLVLWDRTIPAWPGRRASNGAGPRASE
jgi:hypothetical protein